MKKIVVALSLMMFVGSLGTTVLASQASSYEVKQDDGAKKCKKKSKKGCCKDKSQEAGKACCSKDKKGAAEEK
jgi:hypothetical protein